MNNEALLHRPMNVSSKPVTLNLHNYEYLYRRGNQPSFSARRFTGYLSRKRDLCNLLTCSICLEVIKLSTVLLFYTRVVRHGSNTGKNVTYPMSVIFLYLQ